MSLALSSELRSGVEFVDEFVLELRVEFVLELGVEFVLELGVGN